MKEPGKDKNRGMFIPAISNAAIISVALIILSLGFYLAQETQSRLETYIGYAIFLGGLIYSIKIYRDEDLGGSISYKQSLGHSVLVGLFTGIITGIFAFILYGYIAPDLLVQLKDKTIMATESRLLQANPNISDNELDTIINVQLWFLKPGIMMIATMVGMTFQGLVMGLVVSIFMKKKPRENQAEEI